MKKYIAATIVIVASGATIAATPIEPGALIDSGFTKTEQVLDELVGLVRASGYRCDSITYARRMAMSPGFVMACNNARYEYEIEDRGGNWQVTLN